MKKGWILSAVFLLCVCLPGTAQDDEEVYTSTITLPDYAPQTTDEVLDNWWESLEGDSETMNHEASNGFDIPGAHTLLEEDSESFIVQEWQIQLEEVAPPEFDEGDE